MLLFVFNYFDRLLNIVTLRDFRDFRDFSADLGLLRFESLVLHLQLFVFILQVPYDAAVLTFSVD